MNIGQGYSTKDLPCTWEWVYLGTNPNHSSFLDALFINREGVTKYMSLPYEGSINLHVSKVDLMFILSKATGLARARLINILGIM